MRSLLTLFDCRIRATNSLLAAVGLVAAVTATPGTAHAAVPSTTLVEGLLQSSGGAAAADGVYTVTFAIYKDEVGGNPVFAESGVSVGVKGGQFSYALGTKTPLTATVLGSMPSAWLGMKIESDPELPRKPMASVAFALRAGLAEGIDCSGCIKAGHIDAGLFNGFAKTADLSKVAVSGNFADLTGGPDLTAYAKTSNLAKVAISGAFTDLTGGPDLSAYAKLASLADVAKSGNYADLKGIPILAKVAATGEYADLKNAPAGVKTGAACGTGLVMKGIKTDGSYECVQAMDPSALPADGIDEISNGLIANQFVDSIAGTPDVVIKDGFLFGVADSLNFPDIGIAQKLTVSVDISNSNIQHITVSVFDPAGVEHLLHQGDKKGTGTQLKASYPDPTKQLAGDLTSWVGKNPKGQWTFKVVDHGASTNTDFDGKITKWSIDLQTLSNKKIQVKGDLIVTGNLTLGSASVTNGQSLVDSANSWCPAASATEPRSIIGGVCFAGAATQQNWDQAVALCASRKADICSDAQSLVLRRHGMLPWHSSVWSNWTNSWADNDANTHYEAVGPNGDDHGAGSSWNVACCYNMSPKRPTDQQVVWQSGDVGVRVVAIHNIKNADFNYAAVYCTSLNADVCDKSQYVYLRSAGKISVSPMWANDGQDTDGAAEYGTGYYVGNSEWDDDRYDYPHGFACCARERTTLACPAGTTDTGGVCWKKVNNSGSDWVTAARDCTKIGTHICSVSESSVLRKNSVLTHGGNWTGGFSDCDGQCSGNYGIGNASNNLNPNSSYGYACCL